MLVVLNDDWLNDDTNNAAQVSNGHLLYGTVDADGYPRKALYRCNQAVNLPKTITEPILGKRTRDDY